jgi:hypothetical protein
MSCYVAVVAANHVWYPYDQGVAMKKQIGDLVYDTDKAEKVCEHTEFFWLEALYKTPKGRFFMFKSNLLQQERDSDDIVALTPKKAKEFFNKHGDSNEYEKVFGRKIEEA